MAMLPAPSAPTPSAALRRPPRRPRLVLGRRPVSGSVSWRRGGGGGGERWGGGVSQSVRHPSVLSQPVIIQTPTVSPVIIGRYAPHLLSS